MSGRRSPEDFDAGDVERYIGAPLGFAWPHAWHKLRELEIPEPSYYEQGHGYWTRAALFDWLVSFHCSSLFLMPEAASRIPAWGVPATEREHVITRRAEAYATRMLDRLAL